jgi:hypothetical protein
MSQPNDSTKGSHLVSQQLDERLQVLERDKELLLDSYTTRAPDALDSLGPEERRTVYSMLGLRVDAYRTRALESRVR